MKTGNVVLLALVAFVLLGTVKRRAVAAADYAAPGGWNRNPRPFVWTTADQEDADAGRNWSAGAFTGLQAPAGSTWDQSQAGWVERDSSGNVLGVYT